MIPTEESNTATSPLNVILLAVTTWITGVTGALRPVVGLGILTVALSAAMAVWAAQIARRLNVSGAWSLAAISEQYLAAGQEIGELVGDATVKSPPEIGTVAYACECSVVDVFSDPGQTLPLIEKRIREAGPVLRFLLEANFSRLDRTQRPRPAEYRLAWTRDGFPPGLPNWYMNSPWTGSAIIYLEPIQLGGGGGI